MHCTQNIHTHILTFVLIKLLSNFNIHQTESLQLNALALPLVVISPTFISNQEHILFRVNAFWR